MRSKACSSINPTYFNRLATDDLPTFTSHSMISATAPIWKGWIIGLFVVSKVTFGCFVLNPSNHGAREHPLLFYASF